jgi:2-polyprenyl-6-methoxyphenol hydroxylase-like FAD-dependent oxidoreductase
MDRLGLLQKILNSSGQIQKVFFKTSNGKILSKSEPAYDYPVICMHRASLHGILLANIDAKLYTSYDLESIHNKEDGTVELIFGNGEVKHFDAVIGADGIHSAVRKFVVNDGDPVYRGYNIWRGIVKTDFDIGYGSETYGIGKRVGIVPIKDGIYGWWATCNEEYKQDDKPEGSKDKLKRLFKGWHYPTSELIENTEHILKSSISDRIPKKGWAKGNVILIGDAAHPSTPNLGQGGCMAIEGSYILAKSINKYGLAKKAYERYEELQFPRSKMIVNESLKMGKIGQLSSPVLAWLRNLTLKLMPPAIAIKMVDKFFSYRVTKIEI